MVVLVGAIYQHNLGAKRFLAERKSIFSEEMFNDSYVI